MKGYMSRETKDVFLKCKHNYPRDEIQTYLNGFCAKCDHKINFSEAMFNKDENEYYCQKCVKKHPILGAASSFSCIGCGEFLK